MSSTSTSKTSAVSSIVRASRAYSKRFAASATASARRYRDDLFFRTGVIITTLVITFGILLIGFVAAGSLILYRDVSTNLVSGIMESITSPAPADASASILDELQRIRARDLTAISLLIISAILVFGYLIGRFALVPTKQALESQKRFIGNIAHELRTPLSVIKTNTEVALLDRTLPGDLSEMLRSNIEELDRVAETINNLLSLSSLIRPEHIPFDNVDLRSVVDRTVRQFEGTAKEKRIRVTITGSTYSTVWGNTAALEQVVGNLLKNALKYTPEGGTIDIALDAYRANVALTMRDSGIGIERKDLERIFEPFYRTDASRARASGGSGLGLAIVSELIRLHRGSIGIRSAPGRGTSVFIRLPCGKDDAAPPVDPRSDFGEIVRNFSDYTVIQ